MARSFSADVVGIDIGTTGARAVRVDAVGTIVASASASYPLLTPEPGWTEQEPEAWWRAAATAVREVVAARDVPVAGVGVTGQMHGSVFLDERGVPLRPALLWNDQRTARAADQLEHAVGADRLREITGNPALTGFQAPKILWFREHEPERFGRLRTILLPKDFLRYRLSGTLATDASDASGTSLLDLRTRAWSPEILRALDLSAKLLPEVFESPAVVARVSAAASAETGLAAGTPIVAGAGDNAAAAVGSGIVRAGDALVSLGTSGVVLAHAAAPLIDGSGALHAFCAAVPGEYHLMGVILSAGGSLRWARDVLGADASFEALVTEAATVPAGALGVTFLPYLAGERTPHMDPAARGAWLGLSLAHGRPHLVRAVLEGVAYGLADAVDAMRALGVDPAAFARTGSGFASELWTTIVASVLERPLRRAADEGPAYGAALLASVGAGAHASVAAAVEAFSPSRGETTKPVAADARTYRRGLARYRAAYPALHALDRTAPGDSHDG